MRNLPRLRRLAALVARGAGGRRQSGPRDAVEGCGNQKRVVIYRRTQSVWLLDDDDDDDDDDDEDDGDDFDESAAWLWCAMMVMMMPDADEDADADTHASFPRLHLAHQLLQPKEAWRLCEENVVNMAHGSRFRWVWCHHFTDFHRMSRENHDVKTAPTVHGSWPSPKPMAAAALQNGLPGDHWIQWQWM